MLPAVNEHLLALVLLATLVVRQGHTIALVVLLATLAVRQVHPLAVGVLLRVVLPRALPVLQLLRDVAVPVHVQQALADCGQAQQPVLLPLHQPVTLEHGDQAALILHFLPTPHRDVEDHRRKAGGGGLEVHHLARVR